MDKKVTIKVLIKLGIEEKKAKNFNLSNADLSDANLCDADLSNADLSDANLCDANLSDADLRNADLSNADLSDANLCDADLSNADLSDANLCDANLSDADLRNADLRNANLSDADLSDADLSNADLSDANLCDANLCDADLCNADLRNAEIILTLSDYLRTYKIKTTKECIYLYKITKDNYQSFFASNPITYEIGKEFSVNECDNNIFTQCSYGLSVATEDWCRKQGNGRILLVKVHWKDVIAVPINTDGKIRVKKLKVIKEIK